MKKVLFLLLICFIKLNAYEYYVTKNEDISSGSMVIFYHDSNGNLLQTRYDGGHLTNNTTSHNVFFNSLNEIKQNNPYYKGSVNFKEYYIENIDLLNDLYLQQTQPFLNFLYNENRFNNSNYVNYDGYLIFYDSNGLAVESLVNGVYAGLYSMDEMQFSGNLYNEKGDLVLVNGFEPSFFQVLCDKIIGDLHLKMLDAENLIDKSWIFAVALTLAMIYLIARTLKRVLIGKNNKGVSNES